MAVAMDELHALFSDPVGEVAAFVDLLAIAVNGIWPVPLSLPYVLVGKVLRYLLVHNAGCALIGVEGMTLVEPVLVIKSEIAGLVLGAPSQVPLADEPRAVALFLQKFGKGSSKVIPSEASPSMWGVANPSGW